MSEQAVASNQLRVLAARLCWTHPGYGDFITKKDASDELYQYADEMQTNAEKGRNLAVSLEAIYPSEHLFLFRKIATHLKAEAEASAD